MTADRFDSNGHAAQEGGMMHSKLLSWLCAQRQLDVTLTCSFESTRSFIYMLVWEHTTFQSHARLRAFDVLFTCALKSIPRFIYMLVWEHTTFIRFIDNDMLVWEHMTFHLHTRLEVYDVFMFYLHARWAYYTFICSFGEHKSFQKAFDSASR
jgi:hypothetical protein